MIKQKVFGVLLALSVLVSVAGLCVGVSLETGCTKAQETAVVSTLPALGACIIQAAGSDFVAALTDPLSILPAVVAQCLPYGTATAAMVLSVIESWFAAAPATVDAGPALGSNPPLVFSRLKRVHDLLLVQAH